MKLNDYEVKHLQALRSIAGECTVLLKGNGDFPLNGACKIAAYGSGVRNTIKGGTGSGEVNSRYFVNVEQGLEEAGFTITTKEWLDAYDQVKVQAKKDFRNVLKARAKANHTMLVLEGMGAVMPEPEYELPLNGDGEVAIYVLSRISGEGNDRRVEKGDVLLSDTEKRDILALQKKYKKFMLVLNVGGAVDLTPVQSVDNILVLSQLGVETGSMLADLLLGKTYPSGKLTTTWSSWEDYCSQGEFGDINETRYNEGIYVGYRYFDSVGKKALFPFGYGTGYTSFEVTPGEVSLAGEQVTVTASIKNTGKYLGREVVQLYVSVPEGKLDQPYQTLAAWSKTAELKPGQEVNVSMSFALNELASYDEQQAAYVLEQGAYVLHLGTSSADTNVCGVVNLPETVQTLQARNCLGKPDFTDWKPEQKIQPQVPAGVTVLTADVAAIAKQVVTYDVPGEIDPEIKNYSDEELAYMGVGSFNEKMGALSIIGNASKRVAGAAGESTSAVKGKNVPVLVMADGPAGLRLSRQYVLENGDAIAIGESMPESIGEYLPGIAKWIMNLMQKKPKKGAQVYEQYATAIPIGTALAQTWNPEAAEICGDIVGAEMERFGVHLWLAPALNIHRSILCGRNFEYFSEDPLVSGVFAAAITKGVQKHPGCGTTIKHYAANNQENNRYANNSQVSERAMREIYLRGFGICVKESQPHSLMTSYNLFNGVHTSEHRGLTEDILRREYGFLGIVMTDWVIGGGVTANKKSVHPIAQASMTAAAGGDLFMPGCKGDFDSIMNGLKDGKVTREQLQINATRVLRMARKLAQK